MATELRPFPDVEPAVIVYLAGDGDGYTSTPDQLKTLLAAGPVLRVQRIGGAPSVNRDVDVARVSVQDFVLRDPAAPRKAQDLALTIEERLARLAEMAEIVQVPDEYGGGKVHLSGCETESGPVEYPWPDSDIAVVQCIYRISTRR